VLCLPRCVLLSAAAKSIVDRLIAEELKTMPKRPDILSSLPHRELQETVRQHGAHALRP